MNLMYTVVNLRQLGQVGGVEIITPGEAKICGPEQNRNTLIFFPHALQPWNFPSAARFLLTVDQTNLRMSLSSFAPVVSILPLKMSGKYKLSLLSCVYFLLVKHIKCQWLSGLTSADKTSQAFLREGSRVKEQRLYPVCAVWMLCTYRPIGGAMTSRSCSSSVSPPPLLLFCCT